MVGKPARGVKVSLHCLSLSQASKDAPTTLKLPQILAIGFGRETDTDGRCSTLLDSDFRLSPGVYKMTFITGPYFEKTGTATFYPLVEITFTYVDQAQHYHIPLLLSPHSFTTYRGS